MRGGVAVLALAAAAGCGGLGAPATHPIDPVGLASDLGDLDGDGDLDMALIDEEADEVAVVHNGT